MRGIPDTSRRRPRVARTKDARQKPAGRRDRPAMGIFRSKPSHMTRAEAARLRNGYGKNYNGGKYDNPNAQDNPIAVIKFFVFIAGLIYFLS